MIIKPKPKTVAQLVEEYKMFREEIDYHIEYLKRYSYEIIHIKYSDGKEIVQMSVDEFERSKKNVGLYSKNINEE